MHFLYCYIVDDIKKHFELFLEHLLTSMLIIVLLSIEHLEVHENFI